MQMISAKLVYITFHSQQKGDNKNHRIKIFYLLLENKLKYDSLSRYTIFNPEF